MRRHGIELVQITQNSPSNVSSVSDMSSSSEQMLRTLTSISVTAHTHTCAHANTHIHTWCWSVFHSLQAANSLLALRPQPTDTFTLACCLSFRLVNRTELNWMISNDTVWWQWTTRSRLLHSTANWPSSPSHRPTVVFHHHHHHHPRISSRRKSWNKTSGPLKQIERTDAQR